MRKILLFFILVFFVFSSISAQILTRSYNNILDRYEFHDSSRVMLVYAISINNGKKVQYYDNNDILIEEVRQKEHKIPKMLQFYGNYVQSVNCNQTCEPYLWLKDCDIFQRVFKNQNKADVQSVYRHYGNEPYSWSKDYDIFTRKSKKQTAYDAQMSPGP